MFRSVYIKLRNIYNAISKFYASIIVDYTLATISCYLLLILCFSFGLFQARLEKDSEKLTHVKNSETLADAQKLAKLFPYQRNNYFTHKILDLGYYVEIIVKIKDSNSSFMTQHALDKYNQIYDNITRSLSVDFYDDNLNTTRNVTYMENLCPRRLGICAIEGSLVRLPSFQEKLLKRQISFSKNDPTELVAETSESGVDGTSISFAFGKKRKQKCDKTNDEPKCYIKSVNVIRNRFELLSETELEKELSINFMKVFVDYMEQVSNSSEYDLFDVSFHASHMLEPEIIKYSQFDVKYVLASFISIWIIYFLFMWFDLRMFKIYFREKFLLEAVGEKITNEKKTKIISKWFKMNFYLIKTSGFLVFATFLQFTLTIFSTVGLMSLFSIPVNQLLYSIIFILMIINCHQSLMLFKNISDYKAKKNNQNLFKLNPNGEIDKSLFDLDVKHKLTRTIQLILVPSFCTLCTSVAAYLCIGITAQFDAIRYYCYFLVVSLIINFFGQTTFFCPCLVIYLRRVKQNRNCLFFCYKYQNDENSEKLTETNQCNLEIERKTDDVAIDFENENNILTRTDTQKQFQNRLKKIQSNKILNTIYILLFKKTSLFFGTKLKYVLLLLFIVYFIFNLVFFTVHLRIEMPMTDLLPSESYLKKHLMNHLNLFELGPVVLINFVRPFKYWQKDVQDNIQSLINDTSSLPGMKNMEINWLQDTIKSVQTAKEMGLLNDCENQYTPVCLLRGMLDVLILDQNRDDVNLLFNNKPENVTNLDSIINEAPFTITEDNVTISSSRIFLTFKEFTGSQENVQLMNELKALVKNKFNFTNEDVIVYSSVFVYLEQLNEIYTTFISIFVLSFECIFFGSLMLIFDLRTIIIIQFVGISYFVSVIANMVYFGISLNIITMMQLILIPAFLFEFFYHQAYLFLYTVERGLKRNTKQCTILDNENPKDKIKVKRLKFSFEKSSKKSAEFFLVISLFGLNFMYFCDTYNFHSLYIILMSISLNLFLHLAVVYPVLIILFGPNWSHVNRVNSGQVH